MKTSLPGKKNLAGLDVFRVFELKALYNGMDANTFAMSNTRHFLLLALCSLVVLVVVLVFKIPSLSFHVRFVGFVVRVLRAVFHHELRASFDVDE